MGPLGGQEIIVIFLVALLLFGPKKLPELGRMLGKALTEFRRAKNELKATFETHLSELEKETQPQPTKPATDYSAVQYPYAYDEYGQYGDYSSSSESYDSSGAQAAAAVQESDTQPALASSQNSPIPGTVSRPNGVQPVENGSGATAPHSSGAPEEEHST